MTVGDRILGGPRTRAERVRARRARNKRTLEDVARELTPRRRARRRKRHPRRRFDVALPVELGAEIRLPALPALRTGPRLVSFLLLAVVGYALYALLTAPAFHVSEAAVQGEELLTESQVRSIAQADQMPVFLVDPAEARARFASVAEIAHAQVKVAWPNQVEVTVEERKPMVTWKDGYREWWISEEGVAFRKHSERPGLVRIESEEPVLQVRQDPLQQVIDPQVLVAAGVLSSQLPQVEVFTYHPVHGLGFEAEGGWTAYFGVKGDMIGKVRLYRGILDRLEGDGVVPSLINVRDVTAPYYRQ